MRKPAGLVGSSLGALLCALGLAGALVGGARAQDRGETPWLGVYTQAITSSLRDAMDFQGDGVLVNRVVDGSPAERAGVEKGDVIVSVNSRTVRTPEDLSSVVRGARVGQSVRLVVVRDGERRTLDAKLGGRDSAPVEPMDPEDRTFEVPVPPPAPGIRRETLRTLEPDVVFRGMGRGRLGVRVETVNEDLGSYFGVDDGKGALIVEVFPDTPADRIGLKAGDVITSVGDRKIADADDLIRAMRDEEGKVSLSVVRKGSRRTFETELDDAPRAWRRTQGGRERLGFGDRDRIRIVRPEGEGGGELRQELRQLRDELRELRERLDRMDRN